MTKYKLMAVAIACASLVACSTSDRYANKAADTEEYVNVIDYEKIAKVSAANLYSPASVQTVWVNYPKKRVKKSKLDTHK